MPNLNSQRSEPLIVWMAYELPARLPTYLHGVYTCGGGVRQPSQEASSEPIGSEHAHTHTLVRVHVRVRVCIP